ncbi:MAG: hypothetical protein J7641_01525 [Cyanobacteria bacterium SID2]|nr:hypothetical protein [Cyanobacteria bacterium SID2]MBP0004388.1 hypothetical protein [Cyanobacteria bacterium SBC]
MSATTGTPNYPLDQVVERICTFRQITAVDRDLLASVLLSCPAIGRRERNLIDRVFEGLDRGWIWVAD